MKRQSQAREVNLVKTQTPLSDLQNQQEVNDQIFRHVQEMFDGKVDGDVVYIILQELEWNGVSLFFNNQFIKGNTNKCLIMWVWFLHGLLYLDLDQIDVLVLMHAHESKSLQIYLILL